MMLQPSQIRTPTVAHCERALLTLDYFVERWGYREVAFEFGIGNDLTEVQGTFALGYGTAPEFPPALKATA